MGVIFNFNPRNGHYLNLHFFQIQGLKRKKQPFNWGPWVNSRGCDLQAIQKIDGMDSPDNMNGSNLFATIPLKSCSGRRSNWFIRNTVHTLIVISAITYALLQNNIIIVNTDVYIM